MTDSKGRRRRADSAGARHEASHPDPVRAAQITLLRAIVDAATAPIFCLDADLRYVAFNNAHSAGMAAYAGSPPAIGDCFLDHFPSAQERETARENMRRALGGEAFTLDVELGAAGGPQGRRFLEVGHCPIRGAGGRVTGVAIFTTDVTDRRIAEESARTYAQQLRAMLDTLAVGVVHVRDGRVVWMNPALGGIFGAGDELIGSTTAEFFLAPREYEEFVGIARPALASGRNFMEERRMRRRSGEIRWMRLTGRAIDPSIDASDAIWVIEDIHDHRQMVDALRKRDELLRKLSDHVPGLLYQYRYFPDGRATFPYASERIRDVFGTTVEAAQADAMEVFKVIHPDDFAAVMDSIRRSASELSAWRHEFRVLLPDLGERWMLGDSSPERAEDGSVLWHGYATDITERKRAEQVLEESERRHRALFDTNPSPIWVYDLETLKFLAVNESAVRHYGYSRAEFLAMTVKDIRAPEQVPALMDKVAASVEGRIDRAGQWRHRTKDGSDIVVEVTSQVIGFDGRRAKIVVATDVTERLRAEEALRLAEKVFDNSRQGILVTDANVHIVRVNRAFERITGYSQQEVQGRSPRVLSSGRQAAPFYDAMWRSLREDGMWEGELWNRRKDGEIFPEYLAISAVRDADGRIANYVGLFQDIGERKSAEDRIQYLAHHDVLTGLPNRLLLRDRADIALHHARRQGTRLALVFIDLDRFKTINDSLGHEIGDILLKRTSERILAAVRAGDTVCRLGGDEFLVLLPNVGEAEDASRVTEKLIATVSAPYEIEGHELLVTCSAGIAVYPENGNDIDTLQRNADAAMYAAKGAGRNNSQFYSPAMNARALEHLTLEHDLRRALDRNEFFLAYQPQVDLSSGRIVGAEVLIRWRHPDRGVVMPGAFIPIAEESGLIVAIGTWVLRHACRELRELVEKGIDDVPIAVNVSAMQFGKADFVQVVRDALHEAGVAPALLELEVTEGVIMRGSQPVIDSLRQLDQLGVRLSIDDFGTGYSSLSYLRQFPVHKLKIDQSFVREIPANSGDMAIAEAIIGLARALKLKVIAEGVETRAQVDFLRAHRCDEVQGYFFSRPVPFEEFVPLVRAWQPRTD